MKNPYSQLQLSLKLKENGSSYTSGELITLLLLMEKPEDRAGMICDVSKGINISIKDIKDKYIEGLCELCGNHHSEHFGQDCP